MPKMEPESKFIEHLYALELTFRTWREQKKLFF